MELLADGNEFAEKLELAYKAMTYHLSATDPGVRNEMAFLNHEFHRELVLTSVLESVVRTSVICRNFGNYDLTNLRRSMHHHREILEAIVASSPEWSEYVMHAHLLTAQALHVLSTGVPPGTSSH